MRVIEIITQGPQGPQGPQGLAGPTGSIDTASFVTTSSFNQFTSSYNSGSFTGSFFGTASWAQNAVTASLAPNYVLNSSTSSFIQNNQTSSFKGFSSAQSGSIVAGTVNNTFAKALFIPANSYKADDVPEISARVRRVTGAAGSGSYVTRMYWNVTPNIDGTPALLAVAPTVIAGNNSVYFSRNVAIVSATNNTTVTELGGAYASDFGTNANGSLARSPSDVAIDWTQDGYIVVAIQLNSSNGSGYCDLIRIR
jgi:hypothetical protein